MPSRLAAFAGALLVFAAATAVQAQDARPIRLVIAFPPGGPTDFVGRLVADKQFERFFAGHSTDSKKRIRQHIVDQLCAAAGGPCIHTGRTMKDSHMGLGISEAEWDAAAKHLVASLDKFKVPEPEKKELLAFVTSLKADIVEKKVDSRQ